MSASQIAPIAKATTTRFGRWLLVGCGVSVILVLIGLLIGTTGIARSLTELRHPDSEALTIFWQIRLPRSLGAWCAGALLGLAGCVAQGVFRNPLAEPYLLGTASGAALGVALCLLSFDSGVFSIAWLGALGVTGAACLGAAGAIVLTLALSRGVVQTASLLLAGVVVAFLLSAITSLLLLTKPDIWLSMQSFLLGGTALIGWFAVLLLSAVLGVSLMVALALAKGLDALTLGEDTAQSLGLSLPMLRLAFLGLVAVTTATVVGQCGVIGFVGLVAPHLVRQLFELDHRRLLLGSALSGGILLQAADLLSRWLLQPSELPVGAVTACLGGSYLIVLLWRRNRDA